MSEQETLPVTETAQPAVSTPAPTVETSPAPDAQKPAKADAKADKPAKKAAKRPSPAKTDPKPPSTKKPARKAPQASKTDTAKGKPEGDTVPTGETPPAQTPDKPKQGKPSGKTSGGRKSPTKTDKPKKADTKPKKGKPDAKSKSKQSKPASKPKAHAGNGSVKDSNGDILLMLATFAKLGATSPNTAVAADRVHEKLAGKCSSNTHELMARLRRKNGLIGKTDIEGVSKARYLTKEGKKMLEKSKK